MTKPQAITGKLARQNVLDAIALLGEIQRDVVAIAIAGALNDHNRLEEIGREMLGKMQQVEGLLRGALTGEFEDIEKES